MAMLGSDRMTAEKCATCAEQDVPGNCARLRCYCAHTTCWAYDSWQPLQRLNIKPEALKADTKQAASWAARKEPTWLDR